MSSFADEAERQKQSQRNLAEDVEEGKISEPLRKEGGFKHAGVSLGKADVKIEEGKMERDGEESSNHIRFTKKPLVEKVRENLNKVGQRLNPKDRIKEAVRTKSREEIIANNKKKLELLKSKQDLAAARAGIAKSRTAEQRSKNTLNKEFNVGFSATGFEKLYGKGGNPAAPVSGGGNPFAPTGGQHRGGSIEDLFGGRKRELADPMDSALDKNPIEELFGSGRRQQGAPVRGRKKGGKGGGGGSSGDPLHDFYS